jgi:hypothetical protein
MKKIRILLGALLFLGLPQAWSQTTSDSAQSRKFSVLSTYLTLLNWGEEKFNTHHYEFHFRYRITDKDQIGLKLTTWELFEPMGIQFWDPGLMEESEFYPGRLEEKGIGITYQRFLWKKLYASIEVLPLLKRYVDENKHEIRNGFKLYTTYHLGYHFDFLDNRVFLEPQIHCNYWPIDTKAPAGFETKDRKWTNYFLFEPNLYFGFAF